MTMEIVEAEGNCAAGEKFLGPLKPAAGESAAGENLSGVNEPAAGEKIIKAKKPTKPKVAPESSVSYPESSARLDVSLVSSLVSFKAAYDNSSGALEFVGQIDNGLKAHGLKKTVDTHNISGFGSSTNVFRPLNDLKIWIPMDGFPPTRPVLVTYDLDQAGQLTASGKWIELPFAIFSPTAEIPLPYFSGDWPLQSGDPDQNPLFSERCSCWDVFRLCEHGRQPPVAVEEEVGGAGGGGVVAAPKTVPIVQLWSSFSKKLSSYESLFAFVEDGDDDYLSPLMWTSSDRLAMKNRENIVKDYIGACLKEAEAGFLLADKLPTATVLRALAQGQKVGVKTYIEMGHECVEARRAQHK